MSRTLPAAHQAFVASMTRDTPGTDLPRYIEVLDALLAWSAAHPTQLAFRSDNGKSDVLGFERTPGKALFWSVQVARNAAPRLEIHAPPGRPLTADERALAMQTLNAHSRDALVEGERLRIGFGALKNPTARAAVLALMEQLLLGTVAPASTES